MSYFCAFIPLFYRSLLKLILKIESKAHRKRGTGVYTTVYGNSMRRSNIAIDLNGKISGGLLDIYLNLLGEFLLKLPRLLC